VFSIRVPLASSTQQRAVVQQTFVQQRLGDPLPGRRVLVLDNEVSILHSMSALLEQWGCDVLIATDQTRALEVLGAHPPELILADFHLDDGVVGSQVVVHLRQHFGLNIPAVMITADRSDQCRRELHGMGVPLLNKPVKPGKLRAVLSQILQDVNTSIATP
jgi:CheY-like chemotaxis protein